MQLQQLADRALVLDHEDRRRRAAAAAPETSAFVIVIVIVSPACDMLPSLQDTSRATAM